MMDGDKKGLRILFSSEGKWRRFEGGVGGNGSKAILRPSITGVDNWLVVENPWLLTEG